MFQTRLKELREAAGYKSQQAFANAFGVAQSTVGGWESGKREPNYTTTIRLARFFGVSVDTLMGLDEKRTPAQGGEPYDPATQQLIDIFHSVSDSDRAVLLEITKAFQKQREQNTDP